MSFQPLVNSQFKELSITHTLDYLWLGFQRPCPILSNGVLNGGLVEAEGIVNFKVPKVSALNCEDPAMTLAKLCKRQDWPKNSVGMMTAASMKSARIARSEIDGEQFAVVVTTGLANARRAGDVAEYRQLRASVSEVGTINTVLLSSAQLSGAAMAEILILATEAKAALLQELNVLSPVSEKIATGTGTDVTVVASGLSTHSRSDVVQSGPIQYAGKHTLLGEVLAQLVMSATADSLKYDHQRQEQIQCGS